MNLKKIIFPLLIVFLNTIRLNSQSNEYYFAVPQFVKDYQFYKVNPPFNKTFKLVIRNGNQPAIIKYRFMNHTGDIDVKLVPTNVLAPNQVVYCDLTANSSKLNCGFDISKRLYHNRAITEQGKNIDTGLLKVFSTNGATFEAYFETTNGAKDVIYRLFGKSAIGDKFLLPGQNYFNTDQFFKFCNTQTYQSASIGNVNNYPITVNVYPHGTTMLRYGTTPASNAVRSITLGAYQTAAIYSDGVNGTNNIGGTYIESNNNENFVVTFTDDVLDVNVGNSSGQDPAGDQVPSIANLGKTYLLHTGIGTIQEQIYIYATDINTTITVYQHGGATNTYTLTNRGDLQRILASASSSYMINANKPILVYQMSGIGKEVGTAIVPPMGCNGSKSTYLVRPKDSDTLDRYYLTLLTTNCYTNGFRYEVSKLDNWGNSTTWNNVSYGFGSVIWKHQNPSCSNSDGFRSAFVEVPKGILKPGEVLRVTNDSGLFHMGMLFNNTSQTSKFAYLSSFEKFEYKPKVANKKKYCQYEEIVFCMDSLLACTKFKIEIYKNNVLLGTSDTLPTKKCFNIKDLIPFIDLQMGTGDQRVGQYTLKYYAYRSVKLCGTNYVCSNSMIVHPFQIVKDMDTLYQKDTIYFCDFNTIKNSKPRCAKYNPCPTFPKWMTKISPNYATLFTDCFEEGKYLYDCYDTINCQLIRTELVVKPNVPDTIKSYDTLKICQMLGPFNSKTCVKYIACNGLLPQYVQSFPEPPLVGSLFSNENGIYCFSIGKYEVTCFDTFNCIVLKKYINVIEQEPQIIENNINLNICQMNGPFSMSSCAKFKACNPKMPHIIETLPYPGSAFYDTSGLYCLSVGDYKVTCFDTINCIKYITYVNVSYKFPTTENLEDSIVICLLEGPGFGSNCAHYKACNSSMPHYIESLPEPPLFGMIFSNESGEYCLAEGKYTITCFDTINCKIYITNLIVKTQKPDTVIQYDTLAFCNWSNIIPWMPNCAKFEACGKEIPHYIETVPEPPGFSYWMSNPDRKYCLTPGNYIVNCFDTFECKFIKTYLHIKSDTPSIYNVSDSIPFCGDTCYLFEACDLPHKLYNNSTGALIPNIDSGIYCLDYGDYLIECYDTFSCLILKRNFVIYRSDIFNINYINKCADTVLIYSSNNNASHYELYDKENNLIETKIQNGFYVKGNLVQGLPPKIYKIIAYFGEGCKVIDSFIINCCPHRDQWDENYQITVDVPTIMNITCPSNCSNVKVYIKLPYPTWDYVDINTRKKGNNNYLILPTDGGIQVFCYDEYGCECYSYVIGINEELPNLENENKKYLENISNNNNAHFKLDNYIQIPNIIVKPTLITNKFNIEFYNLNEFNNVDILMYDNLGKLVLQNNSIELNSNFEKTELNIEYLTAGVYFIYIPQLNYRTKIIKLNEN